jgi:RND superfamily putative drug exporter
MVKLAELIVRWPVAVAAAWIILAVALGFLVSPPNPVESESLTFLPGSSPSVQADAVLEKYFPRSSGLSQVAIALERTSPASSSAPAATAPANRLTAEDLSYLSGLMARLRQPLPAKLASELNAQHLWVQGPADLGALPFNPYISRDGQAAILLVNVPANYITLRSANTVKHVRELIARTPPPAGTALAITGSAALGADYAAAAETSHRRTLWVTLVAVLVILLAVYRSPLSAVLVIGVITLAALVASGALSLGSRAGLHVGTAERIFVFVLLYGAGVDYSLLYLSRFREMLGRQRPARAAAGEALAATAPTIAASAGTVIGGLAMLSAAQFTLFKTTGQTVAGALVIALLASLTLLPAAAALLGRRLFWPNRRWDILGAQRFWPWAAGLITRRPAWVLGLTLLALAVPAWRGTGLTYVYDTVAGLSDRYASVAGVQAVKRHWPEGEIAPTTLVLVADEPAKDLLRPAAAALTESAGKLPCVANVRSLALPLGKGVNLPTQGPLGLLLSPLTGRLRERIESEYVGGDGLATRLVVVANCPPLSNQAMSMLEQVRQTAEALPPGVRLYVSGSTADMADIRSVTQSDFYRVAALTLGVVFLIVLALLRDVILAGFMVASTVISYLATLGFTWWYFTGVGGTAGLDWKVEVFLFVVMVAVGQDYNIFLAARLAEESACGSATQAARAALTSTGGIISSAGLIMAATLGSLLVGDLALLVQLGFAFALGMLLDTFVVRPLLLPSFAVLTGRTGRPLRRHVG